MAQEEGENQLTKTILKEKVLNVMEGLSNHNLLID